MAEAIKQQRSSNLELYRIIVMFMIVCHHYVVNSGLMEVMGGANSLTSTSLFYYIMGAWGKTGINCFVLITGFFMCKSDITLRKFLKLFLQVYFYDIVINAIFAITGYHHFTVKEALMILWPLKGISDGFTSCFLMFYLCIPFLNAMIHNISKRQHQLLIALLLFGFSIVAFPPLLLPVTINYVTWFCVLYIISSYLRLYPLHMDNSTKFWGIATFIALGLGVLSIFYRLHKGSSFLYVYVSDSNQILSLALAVTSFMFFKNLHIPQSKIINTIASTTFGILLIHANSASMRQWLWKETVDCVGHYDVENFYIYAIRSVACIFFLCSAIDFVRMKTIEKYSFRFIDKYLK